MRRDLATGGRCRGGGELAGVRIAFDIGGTFTDFALQAHDGAPVRLTSAEADLLRVFARHPRTVLSRADIVSLGVNPGEDVGDRAIDVQIARLRRKIEVDPKNPRTLQTVWGEGYVLWPD